MRAFLLALVAVVSLTGAAAAQDSASPDTAIRNTIQSQIDAFLRDDFATAFTFAAPNIRNMFRTPENFGAMVRNGYPMVWRPEDVRFGALREIDGALWQTVILRDAQGVTHALGYRMVEQDGEWRISGVQPIPSPDVSA